MSRLIDVDKLLEELDKVKQQSLREASELSGVEAISASINLLVFAMLIDCINNSIAETPDA